MKLTTLTHAGGTCAARLDGDEYVLLEDFVDLVALLRNGGWREIAASASGPRIPVEGATLRHLLPSLTKVVCVGANYRSHIAEMGDTPPAFPTLFAKFPESLIGPSDDILITAPDDQIDWEGELAVVIGRAARNVSRADASEHIAGYTVCNDISMRSYQFRTAQWLQGKAWEGSTPLGPVIVTSDEFDRSSRLRTWVGDELMQDAPVDDLVFDPETLVEYVSQIVTLQPGDVILTGTPSGVGFARSPQRFLDHGDRVRVEIDGIGAVDNRVVRATVR